MKITKSSPYLMFLSSVIIAKPYAKTSTTELENKNDEEHKIKVRRQEGTCDYLYEDCDNLYEYTEFNIKNSNKEKNIPEKKEFDKNRKQKVLNPTRDYLEDFNYFDKDTTHKIKINSKYYRQGLSTSTPHVWLDDPPEFEKLPRYVELCPGKARCHEPFKTKN